MPHLAGVLDTRGNVHTGEFQWDCSSLGLRVKDLKARLVTWMCGEGGGRSHREWQACGQLKGAGPTLEHSKSKSFKTWCQPSKIWLQHSVVTCPLAWSVTSGSNPTLSKRGPPLAANCGNKPRILCLDEARAAWTTAVT